MRLCTKCETLKPPTSFRVYRRVRSEEPMMDAACNECEKQRKRDWWNEHRARRQ